MARLQTFAALGYVYWPDLVTAGTVTAHTATRFQYTATSGLVVTIFGSGFAYDADLHGVEGVVTRVTVAQAEGATLLNLTNANGALDLLSRAAFGYDRGGDRSDVAPDGELFFRSLLRGDDTIIGSADDEEFLARVSGGFGNDLVRAGGGDDYVSADAGTDTLDGGAGRDELSFNDARDDPLAFRGVDVDVAAGTAVDMWGFTDQISGFEWFRDSTFGDRFLGSAADEVFRLSRGSDTLDGGAGWDELRYDRAARLGAPSGIAVDLALGRVRDPWGLTDRVSHIESVVGTNRADSFKGDAGDNTFQGMKGADSFDGRLGFDTVEFWMSEELGGHGVTIDASRTSGQIRDDGFGNVETAVSVESYVLTTLADSYTGGAGRDSVWGDAGDDTLIGNQGADTLRGGDGADVVTGGFGADQMSGDAGQDSLTGGAGADQFYFHEFGAANRDMIFGFSRAEGDQIWIDAAWGGGLSAEVLSADQFLARSGASAAETAQQRVIYDRASGTLYFDVDGAGGEAAQVFAVLANRAALTLGDIHVLL